MLLSQCSNVFDGFDINQQYRVEKYSFIAGLINAIESHLHVHACPANDYAAAAIDVLRKDIQVHVHDMNFHWSLAEQIRDRFRARFMKKLKGRTSMVFDYKALL